LCVVTAVTRLRRSVCLELSSVESPARFKAHRTNRHLHVSFRWLVLACMPCNKLSCALQWAGGPSVLRKRLLCASCCMPLTEVGTLTHLHFRTTNAFCTLRTTTRTRDFCTSKTRAVLRSPQPTSTSSATRCSSTTVRPSCLNGCGA
jgi:hypothetical protein